MCNKVYDFPITPELFSTYNQSIQWAVDILGNTYTMYIILHKFAIFS